MSHRIESLSTPELTFDVDTAEGREGLKEVAGVYELDAKTWLPFAAQTYHISPNIEDYILSVTPICPADLPNRNGVAFPLGELKKFQPPPVARMVYKAWAGCPVHYEHCFSGDTKILTNKGDIRIDSIQVGDKVMTHEGRYRRVKKVFRNGVKPTVRINALGLAEPLVVTLNHPIWIVGRGQIFRNEKSRDGRSQASAYRSRSVSKVFPHFRPVSDVYPLDYLVIKNVIGGNVSVDPDFAFLAGLWAAEGSYGKTDNPTAAGFTFGYAEKELMDAAKSKADNLGYRYKVSYNKANGTASFVILDSSFALAMKELIGKYSHKKRMKGELRRWDKESLKWFLGGYISGDGSVKGSRMRIRTTSEQLAKDVQMAFAYVGIAASANCDGGWHGHFQDAYFTKHHEVRKHVGGKPFREDSTQYCVGVSFRHLEILQNYLVGRKFTIRKAIKDTGPRIVLVDDLILLPISTIDHWDEEEVFNLEVEEDHTYFAGGVVVHNCNEDCTKAHGVVLDSSLHKINGYGGGKLWKVMGLAAIDKTKYQDIARKVATGEINTYSMGAEAGYFTCSYCGLRMNERGHSCSHVDFRNQIDWRIVNDFDGSQHLAFRNAHDLVPIELSIVGDPAWTTALSDLLLPPVEQYRR